MSALDDAVSRELAHPAGGMADPLTDSLADQCNTQPAPMRPGWENETAEVPLSAWFYAVFLLLGIAVSMALTPRQAAQSVTAQASTPAASSGAR